MGGVQRDPLATLIACPPAEAAGGTFFPGERVETIAQVPPSALDFEVFRAPCLSEPNTYSFFAGSWVLLSQGQNDGRNFVLGYLGILLKRASDGTLSVIDFTASNFISDVPGLTIASIHVDGDDLFCTVNNLQASIGLSSLNLTRSDVAVAWAVPA